MNFCFSYVATGPFSAEDEEIFPITSTNDKLLLYCCITVNEKKKTSAGVRRLSTVGLIEFSR